MRLKYKYLSCENKGALMNFTFKKNGNNHKIHPSIFVNWLPGTYLLLIIYKLRHVRKVSSHALWKIETFIEEGSRNIRCRTMMSFKVGTCGPYLVLPVSIATAAFCPFCSGSRSHRMNFVLRCFMQDAASKSWTQ